MMTEEVAIIPNTRRSAAELTLRWLAGADGQVTAAHRRIRQEPSATSYRFAMIPTARAPRWLVPTDHRRATQRGLEVGPTYSWKASLWMGLLGLACRIGLRPFGSEELVAEIGDSLGVLKLIHELTGERRPLLTLSIGTPGRHWKATVQVLDEAGQVLGLIKVPLTPLAELRVCHEAAVLQELCAPMEDLIPKVLYAGQWQDRFILFQTALPGAAGPAKWLSAHDRFLDRLGEAAARMVAGTKVIDDLRHAWATVAHALDGSWPDLAARSFSFSEFALASEAVCCGWRHGDFAPWNTKLNGEQLTSFDWESSSTGQPLVWDRFHFTCQTQILLNRATPRQDRWGFQTRSDRKISEALWSLYLLRSVVDLLEDGVTPSSIAIRRRADYLRHTIRENAA